MQAELNLELAATSKSEMPKSNVDPKSFCSIPLHGTMQASPVQGGSVAGRHFSHGYPILEQMHEAALSSSSHLQMELLL